MNDKDTVLARALAAIEELVRSAEDAPPKNSYRATRPEVSEAEIERAACLMNRVGGRVVVFAAGDEATGIWSDLDSADVRASIRSLGRGDLPVIYLDSAQCPDHYKQRRVTGEPVPLSVLYAMEAAESEPWRVRDALMNKTLVVDAKRHIAEQPPEAPRRECSPS